MARHNREGRGEDQHGHLHIISYQPDWLHQVKVTRDLESGRQSTKTLFRNTEPAERDPGPRIRTGIAAPELGLALEVAIEDPRQVVRRVTVEAIIPEGHEQGETVVFTLTRKRPRLRQGSGNSR